MPDLSDDVSMITYVRTQKGSDNAFAEWRSKLHANIASFQGFVSLEILSPAQVDHHEWGIVQRFHHAKNLKDWRDSEDRKQLIEDLKRHVIKDTPNGFHEEGQGSEAKQEGVTEVFVAKVSPEKEEAYRHWIGKIHEAEAKFPGFRSVYVQSPGDKKEGSWITLLQFDTSENLNHWLSSPERQEILRQGESLIHSLESHRVISSFGGWFGESSGLETVPPVWKQTLMILLVLFPIVMLELKFLNPLTATLNRSLSTFIANAISVSLVSWPLMPIAIHFLHWWLNPDSVKRWKQEVMGLAIVLALYFLEIIALWNLLP